MAITLGHRWSMRSNLQQSNSLDAFLKSTGQHIFWKCDLNHPNMCFWLSIWPNGHRESQKYESAKWVPWTNEATGLIILSPNSAQKNTWFQRALLIRSRQGGLMHDKDEPLRRQRWIARPCITRPAWPRRALRSHHQRDSGETRFFKSR